MEEEPPKTEKPNVIDESEPIENPNVDESEPIDIVEHANIVNIENTNIVDIKRIDCDEDEESENNDDSVMNGDNIDIVNENNIKSGVQASFPQSLNPKDYFKGNYSVPDNYKNIACVIPVYNEPYEGLEHTLLGLYEQQEYSKSFYKLKLSVLVVLDGWEKTHDSIKNKIKEFYPNIDPYWEKWSYSDKDDKGDKGDKGDKDDKDDKGNKDDIPITAIIEKLDNNDNNKIIPICLGGNKSLRITFCIKKQNRKKFNSHQWFFSRSGFCGAVNPEYCFATDCSTQFENSCLAELVNSMSRDNSIVAATGRQRVMSSKRQQVNESLFSMSKWYRFVQCYDFESSFAICMGAFTMFGFLPVIPGPCGLYRWSKIQNKLDPDNTTLNKNTGVPEDIDKWSPLDHYFYLVNKKPGEQNSGIIESNLRIAEDRILSMSSCLTTKEKSIMVVNPDAVFFFESELTLDKFVKQRRRWINGTVAGYLFLLFTRTGRSWLYKSEFDIFTKIILLFMILGQLSIYSIVAISPAIFLYCLRFLLLNYTPEFGFSCSSDSSDTLLCSLIPGFSPLPNILWLIIFGIYIVFVIHHSNENAFNEWSFFLLLFVGAITIIGSFIGTFVYLIFYHTNLLVTVTLSVVYLIMLLPILITIPNPNSSFLMIKAFIPFYLFLPMLVAFFGAYSFARIWDVSWGNRDVAAEKIDKELKTIFKNRATSVMVFILLSNIVIAAVLSIYSTGDEASYFLVLTVIILFGFTIIQMFLSIVYFSRIFIQKIGIKVTDDEEHEIHHHQNVPRNTEENLPLLGDNNNNNYQSTESI